MIRVCDICKTYINVENKRMGRPGKGKNVSYSSRVKLSSSEGVCFNNHWFCNDCYEKIMSDIVKI